MEQEEVRILLRDALVVLQLVDAIWNYNCSFHERRDSS